MMCSAPVLSFGLIWGSDFGVNYKICSVVNVPEYRKNCIIFCWLLICDWNGHWCHLSRALSKLIAATIHINQSYFPCFTVAAATHENKKLIMSTTLQAFQQLLNECKSRITQSSWRGKRSGDCFIWFAEGHSNLTDKAKGERLTSTGGRCRNRCKGQGKCQPEAVFSENNTV